MDKSNIEDLEKIIWEKSIITSIMFLSLTGIIFFIGLYLKKDIVLITVIGAILITCYIAKGINTIKGIKVKQLSNSSFLLSTEHINI